MTIETRIIALAEAIGADVKALKNADGNLGSLTTTAKTNLVAAINEVRAMVQAASGGGGAVINDAGTTTSDVWSASKVQSVVSAAATATKNELINGAGAALDTLAELATALGNDANYAATVAGQIAKRVRFDAAQTLTGPEKTQVLANIGAASSADYTTLNSTVSGLVTGLGSYDRNYVADYTAAKA